MLSFAPVPKPLMSLAAMKDQYDPAAAIQMSVINVMTQHTSIVGRLPKMCAQGMMIKLVYPKAMTMTPV